jgi:hypothetical protein
MGVPLGISSFARFPFEVTQKLMEVKPVPDRKLNEHVVDCGSIDEACATCCFAWVREICDG